MNSIPISYLFSAGAQCAIIMFDVTSRVTYRLALCKYRWNLVIFSPRNLVLRLVILLLRTSWKSDLTRVCGDIPIVLCCNKVEVKDRKLKAKKITFHRKMNLPYYEISAKANYNLEKPFLWLARELLRNKDLVFVEAPAFPPPVVVQIDEETMHQQNLELEHAASMPLPTEDDDDDICLDCEQLQWQRVKSFVLFLHIGHHYVYVHI